MRSSFTPFVSEPGAPVSLVGTNLAIGNVPGSVAPETSTDWREQNQTCEQLIVLTRSPSNSLTERNADRFPATALLKAFSGRVGVRPNGPDLLPEESESGREQVVVLKHVSGRSTSAVIQIFVASRSR